MKNNSYFKKHCHVDGNQIKDQVGSKIGPNHALPEFTTKSNRTFDTKSKGFIPLSVLLKELYTKVLLSASTSLFQVTLHLVQSIGIFITLFGGNFLSQPSQNMKHSDTINLNRVVHTVSPLKGHPVFLLSPSFINWVQAENTKVWLVSTNNSGEYVAPKDLSKHLDTVRRADFKLCECKNRTLPMLYITLCNIYTHTNTNVLHVGFCLFHIITDTCEPQVKNGTSHSLHFWFRH